MRPQPTAATGHVRKERKTKGEVWYVRYRTLDHRQDGTFGPTQKTRRLGPHWPKAGRPPAGYFTERTANDELVRILDAERERVVGGRPAVVTFREAADEWLRYVEHDRRVRSSTLGDYRRTATLLAAHFGDVAVEQITPQDVEAYKAAIAERGRQGTGRKLAPRTINRHLVILGDIFKRAERKWGIVHNPAVRVEKMRDKGSGRLTFLTPDELARVVSSAATPQDGLLYLMAGMAGLRLGELMALCWRVVDFVGGVVRVERSLALHDRFEQPTKSYKTRSVDLAPELLTALAMHRNRTVYSDDDDLVFVQADGTWLNDFEVRVDLYAALKAAGLGHKREAEGADRFVFQTLAAAGVPVTEIQELMGHAHVMTTQTYMHFAPRKDRARRIGAAFSNAFEVPTAGMTALLAPVAGD
ncbi:tyrosine-type recombinase/integrase [Capillimicrobium parvum]|uniref:Tyrosine recombinase XerC n=1 Tax=Capillimicrobium parvum TaxID=2884022 RepID=A0A9E6XX83_9ACTN|nr:tyrosine-type recombinase/integrase [Capillimicrobium parvum]UGS36094.1 Tyrosine recombinase XerC [Capillimicrobium parvum]